MNTRAFSRLTVLTLVSATLLTSFAQAVVTYDRLYQMGEATAGAGGTFARQGASASDGLLVLGYLLNYYLLNNDNITTRGLQGWVYPAGTIDGID